jgi:hypothetical protein
MRVRLDSNCELVAPGVVMITGEIDSTGQVVVLGRRYSTCVSRGAIEFVESLLVSDDSNSNDASRSVERLILHRFASSVANDERE